MNTPEQNTPRRTPILWILCILTMISAFFSTIAYLAWALAPDTMLNSMEIVKSSGIIPLDQADKILSIYTSIESWQYIFLAVVQITMFAGAFIMLAKLDTIGFHIYTISQISQFIILNFMIGGSVAMDLNSIIMAILWVLMYATQLKFMRNFSSKQETGDKIN